MSSPRGDRLEAVVSILVRAIRGRQNLSKVEKQLDQIQKSTKGVNRELRTFDRLQRTLSAQQGIRFNDSLKRYQDTRSGRIVGAPHFAQPQVLPAIRDTRQEAERSRLRRRRTEGDESVLRAATRGEQGFVDNSQQKEALRLVKATDDATRRRGQAMIRNNAIASQAAMIEKQHLQAIKDQEAAAQRVTRMASIRTNIHTQQLQKQQKAREKAARSQRRQVLAANRINNIHKLNNQLLAKQGLHHRRNYRNYKLQQRVARRTLWALRQNIGLTKKLQLATHGVLSGSLKIGNVYRMMPPRLKIALKLLLGMAVAIGGILFAALAASRAVQALVSESALAGTTIASVYRSGVAGTSVGIPLQEAYQLTAPLGAEAASNLSGIIQDVKLREKANKTLSGIGSQFTFKDFINLHGEELERTIIKELSRLENTIENKGRRIAAQMAFLEDVIGFSEFDEAFPLASVFRRGEGKRFLAAWESAQPLSDETYNRAARLAGMFERMALSFVNVGSTIGSALEPLLAPSLTAIARRLENLALWLERNPDVIANWFRGFLFYAEPFLRILDVVVVTLGFILFLINAIIWATGKLVSLINKDQTGLGGATFTGAILTALPPFQEQNARGVLDTRPIADRSQFIIPEVATREIVTDKLVSEYVTRDTTNETRSSIIESTTRETIQEAQSGGSTRNIINNYYSVESNDEITVEGSVSPEATADAISERDRIQFLMHGAR